MSTATIGNFEATVFNEVSMNVLICRRDGFESTGGSIVYPERHYEVHHSSRPMA